MFEMEGIQSNELVKKTEPCGEVEKHKKNLLPSASASFFQPVFSLRERLPYISSVDDNERTMKTGGAFSHAVDSAVEVVDAAMGAAMEVACRTCGNMCVCVEKCVSKALKSVEQPPVIVPYLRGKIHLLILFLSPLWIVYLFSKCSSFSSFISAGIAITCCFLNSLASALFHCGDWTNYPKLRKTLNKIDHAGIFAMISGSTTPIPMLLFDFGSSLWLLILQWGATIWGVAQICVGDLSSGARVRRASTYVFVGVLHAIFLKDYIKVLTGSEFFCVMLLAISYILGAIVYARKWPDPFPKFFGFHEVFHSFCLLSFLCTLQLNVSVLERVNASGNVK